MEPINPYRAPHEVTFGDAPRRQHLLPNWVWFCLAFYALAIVFAIRSMSTLSSPAADLLVNISISLCLAFWALSDARRRGQPIARSLQLWFFLFAWIVVPGYVIRTRGWKGLGWVVVHGIGWFLTVILVAGVIEFVRYG